MATTWATKTCKTWDRPAKEKRHFLSGIDVDYYNLISKRYCWPPGINATGRRMIFSGPDDIKNHMVSYQGDHMHVGIGTMSPERTSSLSYLTRPDWKNPPRLQRKHERTAEVGWGIPRFSDPKPALTGHQIRRGLCWGRAEDNHTHLYQNPWSPMPTNFICPGLRPKTAPAALRSERRSSQSSSNSSINSNNPQSVGRKQTNLFPSSSYQFNNGQGDYRSLNRKSY